MLLLSLINQNDSSFSTLLLIVIPLLLFFLAISQPRNSKSSMSETLIESWFTIQDIETTYRVIEEKMSEWYKEAKEKKSSGSFLTILKKVLIRDKEEERFLVKDTKPPRLYHITDKTGPIYFELTEVVGGGSVVKTTYSYSIKTRMAKLKADLPLRIPATPIGNRCASCGKPVLPEFNLCPYCGEKIIKE